GLWLGPGSARRRVPDASLSRLPLVDLGETQDRLGVHSAVLADQRADAGEDGDGRVALREQCDVRSPALLFGGVGERKRERPVPRASGHRSNGSRPRERSPTETAHLLIRKRRAVEVDSDDWVERNRGNGLGGEPRGCLPEPWVSLVKADGQ